MIKFAFIFLTATFCILFFADAKWPMGFGTSAFVALGFLYIYLFHLSKNYQKAFKFQFISFLLGFGLESYLSNIGFYSIGVVDYPFWVWPSPWVAAIWLVFPSLSYKLFQQFNNALASAALSMTYLALIFCANQIDLVFFKDYKSEAFMIIVVVWLVFWEAIRKSLRTSIAGT